MEKVKNKGFPTVLVEFFRACIYNEEQLRKGSTFRFPACIQQEDRMMLLLTALIIMALYVILVLVRLVRKENSVFGYARDGQRESRWNAA